MFRWFKSWLVNRVDEWQRREIARLHQETIRLKQEVEQMTGKPIQLTPKQRRRLAEKADGIDADTLKQISVFDPKEFTSLDHKTDSTENQ